MGTSLSFHKRDIYRTNRLLVTTLTAIFILNNLHQISCAVIPDTSLMGADSTRRIRHSSSKFTNMFARTQTTNTDHINRNNSADTDSYFGIFSIKSPCSDKYVRIYNNITAKNENAAQIQFEKISGTENQFYIRRINARKYVCISRRGKLLIRSRPTDDHRCAFTQIPTESLSTSQSDNLVIKIRSVAHNSWYIGFKNNGNPMKAWQYELKRDKKCFHLQIQKYSSLTEHLIKTRSISNLKLQRHTVEHTDNSHLETT